MTDTTGLGKEIAQRTSGVMVAEGAGMVTSLGALLLIKKVAGPERMATAKEQVAMDIVLPVLNRIERVMGRARDVQGRLRNELRERLPAQEESAMDLVEKASEASGVSTGQAVKKAASVFRSNAMSNEDKARKYADTLLDFSIMAPVGILTRIWAQDSADRAFGAPPLPAQYYFYAKVPDMLASNISLLAMNTVAKAPARAISGTIEKLLAGMGVDETSAKSMATYLTYVQGTNVVGNMANVAYVTHASRQLLRDGAPPDYTR